MLKNNIEKDIKMRCIEKSTTQAQIAENIGTSPSNVNKIVRNKEQIMNLSSRKFFSLHFTPCAV